MNEDCEALEFHYVVPEGFEQPIKLEGYFLSHEKIEA